MLKQHRASRFSCSLIGAILTVTSSAHADLLGYWSANTPDNVAIINDQGNADLDGELFGDAAYGSDKSGHTGQAGDYALEFGGFDEDYASLPNSEGVTFDEITLTTWVKGVQTGAWSGIFQARHDAQPIGIGYNDLTGNLTYTWNNNNGATYGFGGGQPQLNIPEDEWTFLALSLTPEAATLYVGPQGGNLESATNAIAHLPQTAGGEWRLAEDNCCGTERNFEGLMDDAAIWNHALQPTEIAQLHAGEKIPSDFLSREGLRQVTVGGDGFGIENLAADISNVKLGEPSVGPGLAQYWFDGNMRIAGVDNGVDAYLAVGETGNADFPLVTTGPFSSDSTWWSGNGTLQANGKALPKYPTPGLAGTRFDGSADEQNYGVKLKGEIFIDKNGEFLIRDGIDDFTMIAIDMDGNGVLDSLADLTNDDMGTLFPGDSIGDVLVLDDAWSNAAGGNQSEAEHAIASFQNIDANGEWRAIEIWMGEGGGGDSGVVYMGATDNPNIFDETNGGNLSQAEIDEFIIPNDKLRSSVAQVESADAIAKLRDNVEYQFQVGPDGADGFVIDDRDGAYTTTLDVADATIRIAADGNLAEGTVVKLFDADNIVGLDTLTLLFDDAAKWNLSNLANGLITFGAGLLGDFDGSGIIDVADIDMLSSALNGGDIRFDLNGDAVVDSADHTAWVKDIAFTWFGDANLDGEFSSSDFVKVFQAGKFETGNDATWGEGDWNGDGVFSSGDFVKAFQDGGFEMGQRVATSQVPEPSGIALLAIGLLGLLRVRRRI